MTTRRSSRSAFLLVLLLATLHSRAATIVAGPGESGLRAAISAAQSGDTVSVTNHVVLTSTIGLSNRIAIVGSPGAYVLIFGEFDGALFHIVSNHATFEGLRFDGSSKADGFRADAELTLRDCTLSSLRYPIVQTGWYPQNTWVRLEAVTVAGNVEGLRAQRVEATNSVFSHNGVLGAVAQSGVYDRCTFESNRGYGLVAIHATVRNSVFRYNEYFGLLFDPDPGRLVVDSSLFYANPGGGILLREEADASLDNCTFTRHTGRPAITVTEASRVRLRHCTVVDNVVINPGTSPWYPDGGAIALDFNGLVELQNCLVAENPTSIDPNASGMSGSWRDLGGNVIGGTALVSVLQDHGGATMTLLPLPGSPAIDAGVPSDLVTDATGLSRMAGAAPDAGAVEAGAAAVSDSDGDGLPDSWELFYSLNPALNSDAASDSDLDGLSALGEFHSRTSPTNAASALRIDTVYINVIDEAENLRHATLQWTSAPGATYEVEMSTDLREWRRAPGFIFGGAYGLYFGSTVDSPAAFFRLVAR